MPAWTRVILLSARLHALEALLWLQPLPSRQPPAITPDDLLRQLSMGGGTVPPAVATIFADPWPEDLLARLLFSLTRRLFSAPGAAEYLLACAGAAARACPSRVKHEQLHQMWDTCLRASEPQVKLAAVRSALSLLSSPAPPIASPPSAAAPEVKVVAAREEAAYWALVRSAAWWLGENANFATNEFVWKPRPPPPALGAALETADGVPQELLAAAAVAANPLLSMILTHLQRAMVAAPWEVRIATAQAIAKVGVRSGEPFRVQCYSMLATARGAAGAAGAAPGGGAPGDADAAPAGGGAGGGGAGARDAAAGLAAEAWDPLGVAACVGPALEVLDHMYGGEVVVQELIDRFGHRKRRWPKKLIKSVEDRSAALTAAICERVCFVPKDLFWPMGPACKDLLSGKYDEEDARDAKAAKDKAKRDAKEAADKAAAAKAGSAAGDGRETQQQRDADAAAAEEERGRGAEKGRARDGSPAARRYYQDSSDEESEEGRRAHMLEQLQGYDYNPQQTGGTASVRGDELPEYPEEPLSEYGGGAAGGASDDDSDIVTRRATVLYDFEPQEEDEVGVAKGAQVDVVYEVGGWLQVITPSGARGLVPRTYVSIHEDDDDGGGRGGGYDARSMSSRASSALGETQAGAAADYNDFLSRSAFRLKRRSSADSGGYRRSASAAGARAGEDEVLEEEVDPSAEALSMGQVQRLHPAVDKMVEQVDDLDAAVRSGAAFNQPQYLALREQVAAMQGQLEALAVVGQARLMRGNLRQRAAAAADKLEAARRAAAQPGAFGGGPPGTPLAAPAAPRGGGGGDGGLASPGGLQRRSSAGSGSSIPTAGATAAAAAALPPLELPPLALEAGGGAARGASEEGGEDAGGGGGAETYQYTSSRARVVYAFDAEAEGELTVAEGEPVWVEAETDGWFTVVREADGARGLVPASYVEMEGFA
ncbi:MAG: hypothetical protein J3K34DRAFT_527396 [Monoraphidium minutum]|nr:MAG: hypothetical protein J3K34DRAFT_527396 [Monoraphidium minutum]